MNALMRWRRPEAAWPTFGRLSELRSEIDKLFNTPFGEMTQGSGSDLMTLWTPAMDVHEDKDNLYVRVEIPGMRKEDIEVSLHDGVLSISGERRQETAHEDAEVYRSERFFGRFHRGVSLPAPVATDKVKAQYKDGILSITLPKTEEAKPKQIDVNIS